MKLITESITYKMINLVLSKNKPFVLEEVMLDFKNNGFVYNRKSTRNFLNQLLDNGLLVEHYPYFSVIN